MLASWNRDILVDDLVKQRSNVVAVNTHGSHNLIRCRSFLGLGVDRHTVCLDRFLSRDFGDGLDTLTSPLVVHFHPPDPLCVGVVEGLQTDRCGFDS